ncbi:hypothetical protein SK128_007766 [Halocaridina rubra]|uniref:Uncharacterized protein n=1 Tax=Halocaridina rubra TaxID=373956 RepID=A0AAN8XF32_HALRR
MRDMFARRYKKQKALKKVENGLLNNAIKKAWPIQISTTDKFLRLFTNTTEIIVRRNGTPRMIKSGFKMIHEFSQRDAYGVSYEGIQSLNKRETKYHNEYSNSGDDSILAISKGEKTD